jgi:NADH-quinone oxidoreductase subunit J
MLATIAFYVFATILLGSAALVVSSRNAVHSVLFLILAFFNAAGLFLLAGAEFLAMILVIVYVGAVAVLFLFVVMMLDVNFTQLREGVQRYAPVGATIGLILFGELIFALGGWHLDPGLADLRVSPMPAGLTNTTALGVLIYTHYVLLFQLAGLVLLVAMMGAIVLTLRDKPEARRQIIARQVGREVGETLLLVDVKTGAGIRESGLYRPIDAKISPPLAVVGATNPDLLAPPAADVKEQP